MLNEEWHLFISKNKDNFTLNLELWGGMLLLYFRGHMARVSVGGQFLSSDSTYHYTCVGVPSCIPHIIPQLNMTSVTLQESQPFLDVTLIGFIVHIFFSVVVV